MSEPSQTVYEALGADIGIRKAVDEFYARVLADPELQPFFADVDMTTLRRHQVDMLSAATGGPRRYDGLDMAAAHAGRAITSDAFGRVVGHLVATLESLGADGETIDRVVATLAPLESSIVTA
jgi:hemoglobin